MATRDFRQQLGELQAAIKTYFDGGSQATAYNVEGFVNQDVALYRQYDDVQDKFDSLAKLFEKDRKDPGSPHVARSEEYLKQENELLKKKIAKQEAKLKTLKSKLGDFADLFEQGSNNTTDHQAVGDKGLAGG